MLEFYQYPYPVRFMKKYLEKNAYNLCKDFIEKNRTMLALSWGKDSMCILALLNKFNLIDKLKLIMFNNSGFESDETLRLRDYVIKKYKIKNYEETIVKEPEKFIKMDLKNSLKTRPVMVEFVYNVLEKPRWKMMDKYNIDGTIIGLRIQESKGRKFNYYKKGIEYYNKREKSNILQPLVKWKEFDVFSYLYTEKFPINPVYYRAKKIGFDYKKIRVNTIASLSVTGREINRIHLNKILYPKEFNYLLNKIPEIRRFL